MPVIPTTPDVMRVTVHEAEVEKNSLRFSLDNCDPSFANSLRRVTIAEVPTIAIEQVFVEVNTTVLFDEYLCHRLGLVPLVSNYASQMVYARDCTCIEGCDRCMVNLTLDVVCPPGVQSMPVTTKMIKSSNEQVGPVALKRPDDVPGIGGDGGVILKLSAGQHIKCRLIARKGIGKEHAKFQPVATTVMGWVPKIELDQQLMDVMSEKDKETFVASCPTAVFKYNTQSKQIKVDKEEACIFCRECIVKAEELGADRLVRVKDKKSDWGRYSFNFAVEGTGHLDTVEVVRQGVGVIRGKLKRLRDELERATNPVGDTYELHASQMHIDHQPLA